MRLGLCLTSCCVLVGCSDYVFVASDGGSPSDANADVTLGDASNDAPVSPYGELSNAASWSTFDTSAVDTSISGFSGATFDGKFVYFVPAGASTAARHDTTKALDDVSAWDTFDIAGVGGSAGYAGAAFDGRYVYYAPDESTTGPISTVIRFDTLGGFKLPSAWSEFDLAQVNLGAKGFVGVVSDGRYLYFIPNDNLATNSVFARYDTQGAFASANSWSVIDVTLFHSANGFAGGVFDGRYLYAFSRASNILARYDTTATFGAAASWAFFDASSFNGSSTQGFLGGAFDGVHLYAPMLDGLGTLLRYDTTASFTAGTSWSSLTTTGVAPSASGYIGGGFDGRFAYFNPIARTLPDGGADVSGLVLRYDTTASFVPASFGSFDLLTLTPPVGVIDCCVFDGEHMYFASIVSNVVARFDARTPASMPALPAFHGSFF